MLNLRQSQLDVLAADCRTRFVQRLAVHLDDLVRDLGRPSMVPPFSLNQEALAAEVDFLIGHGLTTESDVATVLELCVMNRTGPHDTRLVEGCLSGGLDSDEILECIGSLLSGPPSDAR